MTAYNDDDNDNDNDDDVVDTRDNTILLRTIEVL